jgi:uncharacterized membrane protein YraQ (UPF0718 family)
MNKGLLIIAIPAIVITVFWLTLGWGWHTAAVGGCLEIAVVVALAVFTMRRNSAASHTRPRDSSAQQ